MWMENMERRRRLCPWEYGTGDKAYIGCPEILTESRVEEAERKAA